MTQQQVWPSLSHDLATCGRPASSVSMVEKFTKPGDFIHLNSKVQLLDNYFQWWTLHLSGVKLWKEVEQCEWSETPHVIPACGIQNSWAAKGGGSEERKAEGESSIL